MEQASAAPGTFALVARAVAAASLLSGRPAAAQVYEYGLGRARTRTQLDRRLECPVIALLQPGGAEHLSCKEQYGQRSNNWCCFVIA